MKLDTGYWMLDTGCRILDAGKWKRFQVSGVRDVVEGAGFKGMSNDE